MSYVSFNFCLPFPNLLKYLRAISTHTDFQKFKIYYGSYISQNSLMTCYVEVLKEGQYIHFLDAKMVGIQEQQAI
jgi:hypothetical protein